MSKKIYRVRVTADVTVSSDVDVIANSQEEAEEKALDLAYSCKIKEPTFDEGNDMDFYVTHSEEIDSNDI